MAQRAERGTAVPFSCAIAGNFEAEEDEKAFLGRLKDLIAKYKTQVAYASWSGSYTGTQDLKE
jgi:hypothetical protein